MPDHLNRTALAALYALAREACTGARVLDLFPGEGDGPVLLAEWGARGVMAIGAPPSAPDGTPLARPGVSFLDADPCGPYRLEGAGSFDLVLALGLPPAPRDERALMETVKARLAPGGVAILRFPADGAARAIASTLPALAREVLGAPTQILVSMPIEGVILVDSETRRLDPARGVGDQHEVFVSTRVAGGEGRIERAMDIVLVWGQAMPDAAGIAYAPDPPPPPPAARGFLARLLRRRGKPPPPAA
jgi:SAM-dependent methyltransferase